MIDGSLILVDSSAFIEYYRPSGLKAVQTAVAEVIASERVAVNGIIQVEIDVVKLPTGHTVDMEIVRHPGSVVLLPIPQPLLLVGPGSSRPAHL